MTNLYFVRHSQPDEGWENDRTRPLTPEGSADSEKVTDFFRNICVKSFLSSPYRRSIDTIQGTAHDHQMDIETDERLRERTSGLGGGNFEMFQKRWSDFAFHESGGESLKMVQQRNMEAVLEILDRHKNEKVVIGTHGTALSTILNYYEPSFGCENFLRIIDFMPYIIRLDFNGTDYAGREELLVVSKGFKAGG